MPEKTQAVFVSTGGATKLHGVAGCANGSDAPASSSRYNSALYIPITDLGAFHHDLSC